MQIHELNTKALTDPAYVAFDDGTDTYKTEFNDCVESAANAAVAAADLTQNDVVFTSGDAASPTAWSSVSVLTSGSTLATLFNRISTMVKNVRYLWNLIGSSSFSNVASTLSGAIGNTALTTTAQTLSGAIAEHESDISTLNGKVSKKGKNVVFNAVANNTVNLGTVASLFSLGSNESIASIMAVVPAGVDTTIYNNFPEVMIFNATGGVPTVYVKTYKTASNTSLDLYATVIK